MAVGLGGAVPRALANVFARMALAAPGAARVWPAALAAAFLVGLATIPNAVVAAQAETKLPALQISSKVLLQRYAVENVACRGGSGDQTETWEHCGKRDYIAELLSYIGITP